MSNEITAFFKGRVGVCESLYQYDYGMVMVLDDVDFGSVFDAYFQTTGEDDATPVIGRNDRVAIPDSCLSRPGTVTLHIPVHTGLNDSEVEYTVTFKVIGRARPIYDGTPEESTAIAKALAVLQDIQGDVSAWLDDHPEATTTVVDGAVTYAKLHNSIKTFVTPEMFGAKGDGITDDTDAWEQAIESSNYILCFEKNYKITSGLTISKPITIECVTTQRRQNQRYYLDFSSLITGSCITLSDTSGVTLKNINILGSRSATIGIDCNHVHHCNFDNVGVYSQNRGLNLDWAWDLNLQNCIYDDCNICVRFLQLITTISFLNCIFYNSTEGVRAVKSVIGSSLVNCAFDTVDKCILLESDYTNSIGLYSCSFEHFVNCVDLRAPSKAVISGCFFQESTETVTTLLGDGRMTFVGGSGPSKITNPNVMFLNTTGLETSNITDGKFITPLSRTNSISHFGSLDSMNTFNIRTADQVIAAIDYTDCTYFVGSIKYVNSSSDGGCLIFGLRDGHMTLPTDSSIGFVNDTVNNILTITATATIAYELDVKGKATLVLA